MVDETNRNAKAETNAGLDAGLEAERYGQGHCDGPAHSRWLGRVLWALMAVVLLAMALRVLPVGLGGRKYVPIIVALMPWFIIPTGVVAGIALAVRRRALAVISLICIVIQVFWHWGYIVPAERLSDEARQAVAQSMVDTADRYARVMTLNTKNGLADAGQIVRIVRDEHVEVLALQEVSPGLLERLGEAGLLSLLPYSNVATWSVRDNGGVNALWSAAPMSDMTNDLIPIDASSIPASNIDFGGVAVCFGSVHPFSPRPSNQGLWSEGLSSIGRLRNGAGKYVLMGDFNAVWDHASFRYLLGDRFLDAGERAGSGFHMTYPANKKLLGVIPVPTFSEIDHIVHDRGVTVGDLEVRDIAGSDHKALLGTLEVKAVN
ncbi:endonuclease/exonuclease/phosphatase family protein [Bifidobacterium sp. 64T4]|uniref:endonuclease/exonuclease/phosphatase family protein n=1 Tax=Bifidobacterium pongonis TaxID=2834432 RepID=UPI001C595B1D|nr:endonuclease/exonuclease/phosphatase family protein [Bifidobacterium pongonis]MBW3095456.1 endonuclease/exonuclease/phosphatase family protein [Bifidobacterium pongonis]